MLALTMVIGWFIVVALFLLYAFQSSKFVAGQVPWEPTTPPRRLITDGYVGLVGTFGGFLFGRWWRRAGKLVEGQGLPEPWPTPESDPIAANLRRWRMAPYSPPTPEWPKWQSLWPRVHFTEGPIQEPTLSKLWVPSPAESASPPYARLAQPPSFPAPPEPPSVPPAPPEPALLPVDYPEPELILPLWGPDKYFWLLNRCVEAAHSGLVARYKTSLQRHVQHKLDAEGVNKARAENWRDASKRRDAGIKAAQERFEALRTQWADAKRQFEEARNADLLPMLTVESLLATKDPEGIRQHFELALRWRPLPSFVPTDRSIAFEPETGVLLVEQRFPETARLAIVKGVLLKRGLEWRYVTKSERKHWIAMLHPSLLLRIARTLAEADTMNVVKGLAVNGWIDFNDRATGHPRRAYCACLFAEKPDLLALNFDALDPVECLHRLGGRDAGEIYEAVPVTPVLRMNMEDPRFIEARDVLGHLRDGQNLAAMPWEDFEHLVRELFEKVFAAEGATVKITRASRDDGVDAVIFNNDPIKGGKTVVQAKRYTNPVEPSAVRELLGTVTHERANRGILVTTSYFGADAIKLAQHENLTLFDGRDLLGLLEQHGLRGYRIDLAEAKALLEQSSS